MGTDSMDIGVGRRKVPAVADSWGGLGQYPEFVSGYKHAMADRGRCNSRGQGGVSSQVGGMGCFLLRSLPLCPKLILESPGRAV